MAAAGGTGGHKHRVTQPQLRVLMLLGLLYHLPAVPAATEEPSRVTRSDSGQKMILRAFYRQGSNFEALVRPLRASARAGDRPGHTILIKYLCPTEPDSVATSPVLRYLAPKNHYTAEFKLQPTTRPFCLPRPFRPYPAPRTGRGTQLNSQGTLSRKEKGQNWLVPA